MAEKPTPENRRKPANAREDRLKAALKANLARRKAQARARKADVGTDATEQDKDS